MICPYCKMKIKDSSSFCIMCGQIFFLEDIGYESPPIEKELFSYYYKDGKIPWRLHRISCGYLFFGFIYALYKKMYSEAIISMIATIVFIYFSLAGGSIIMNSMGFYFYLVISIILITLAINFYYLFNISYLKLSYVRTKITRTMTDYKDDEAKQREICLEDSKNNLWAPIISGIIVIAMILVSVVS